MIKIIEKIEGEAKLNFNFKENKIDFVDVEFMSTRNIENILKGKRAFDALVINPRVCGICGHAHLMATVQALESCYDNLILSDKAKIIRELTLNFELIQNHFKWFYLTLYPLFGKKQQILKATYPSQLMSKAIAVIGGQYPHTSYAIVGGVACEITEIDLIKVQHYIAQTLKFVEQNLLKVESEVFLKTEDANSLYDGDLTEILDEIKNSELLGYGKSYDRFISFGENSFFKKGKSVKTKVTHNISLVDVKESQITSSFAKNVSFKDKYYEVGPLSRAMINKTPLIIDVHKKYGDSIFSRILARIYEISQLLEHSRGLIKKIDLSQPSYIEPSIDISKLSGSGYSAVEAARGTLIHRVELESGIIKNYEIITPTQWNLSGGTRENHGVSQRAMVGLSDVKIAELVFKSFDVCSVCTTH
ncbi:Nickel-dependent hydrogenase, large subunit [Sulfurimonas denitrificans DSM 1251]|uniref:Nickel-dependent hydrogenase, large subunit n=1 Tax=Sulfurimonas denitrificans (strain ATCC 33889 / DSM 1251) TaxID=326298 RepID=Q30QL7_SULDN|nr:nickel-dependent hydrogenase large subunit [Sulfurimonas denitrificans]ABB44714.1 Nickel-dependent hydrogenase, large subunit [Sulfurimonas denitrificans DSM 1251]